MRLMIGVGILSALCTWYSFDVYFHLSDLTWEQYHKLEISELAIPGNETHSAAVGRQYDALVAMDPTSSEYRHDKRLRYSARVGWLASFCFQSLGACSVWE